jgi:hypothetical protein
VSEAFIEGDALRVFHCLVAIISNEEGNAIDDMEVKLLSAPKKFISAHPIGRPVIILGAFYTKQGT